MVTRIVRDLDLRADGIPTRDASIARVQRCVIDTPALGAVVKSAAYSELV